MNIRDELKKVDEKAQTKFEEIKELKELLDSASAEIDEFKKQVAE